MNQLMKLEFIKPLQQQHREYIQAVNQKRFESGNSHYQMMESENPVIQAAKKFDDTFKAQCKFPDNACSNCDEKELGMTIEARTGLCLQCTNDKTRNKLGPENNVHPYPTKLGGFPHDVLGDLTQVEKMAIAMVLPVMRVYSVRGAPTVDGHAVCYPQDVLDLADRLPRLPSQLSIVVFKSPFAKRTQLRARKHVILNALNWLKLNNPAYNSVVLDPVSLDSYPDDGPAEVLQVVEDEEPDHQQQAAAAAASAEPTTPDLPSDTLIDEAELEQAGQVAENNPREMESDIILGAVRRMADLSMDEQPVSWPHVDFGEMFNDSDPDFWSMAFPYLFPYGQANYHASRMYPLQRADWVLHLLWLSDQRFATDTNFIFYSLNFVQKEQAWSAGNIYASNKLRHLTKTELLDKLKQDNKSLFDFVREVQRSSFKVAGSPAYLRMKATEIQAFSNFLRHTTNDQCYFNLFQTTSAADLHWNHFFSLFEDGRKHLAKQVVQSVDHIPDNCDQNNYVTKRQDFLFRRKFIVTNQRYFNLYFHHQLFNEIIMKGTFGCIDYVARKEFQGRGAIHEHALLCVPLNLTGHERRMAMHNYGSDFEQHQQYNQFSQNDESVAASIVRARQQFVRETHFQLGICEQFFTSDPADILEEDGGLKTSSVTNQVLRTSFAERCDQANALLELQELTCLHDCSKGVCKRHDKNRPTINGQPQTVCRFGFPRELLHYEHNFDDQNKLVSISRTDRGNTVPGQVVYVDDPLSGHFGNMMVKMNRNHKRVNNINPDLLLAWGANMDTQIVTDPLHTLVYIAKYATKDQSNPMTEEAIQKIFDTTDECDTRKIAQKIIMAASKSHPITLAEAVSILNQNPLVSMTREFVYFNALGSTTFDLDNPNPDGSVLKRTRGDKYDDRNNSEMYQSLLACWDSAPTGKEPLHKDPRKITLYEYLAYYKDNWTPLPKFKVINYDIIYIYI